MLEVSELSKSFADQVLFTKASFTIGAGEKIGLIGRNGHGKSTLFKLILGTEEADTGSIYRPKDYKIDQLAQHIKFTKTSVIEESCTGLATNTDGWQETYKAESILMGLGFNKEQFNQDPRSLSGGYQVRLNLCKLLVSDVNLLLLDEPTNYLDIISLRWLERFLKNWKNELILITHDRSFMDKVVSHTMAIHRQKLKKIKGNTNVLYKLIIEEEEHHEKTRQNQIKQRQHTELFIRRFRSKASKAKQVQSKIKALDRQNELDELSHINTLDFKFRSTEFPGKRLLEIKQGEFFYESQHPLIHHLNLVVEKGERIAVIGKNGKGKSTLLRIIANELKLISGDIVGSSNLRIGYFGQTNIDRLNPDLSVEEEISSVDPNLQRTAVRNICGSMMFEGNLALKKISVLSGGERTRVMLGKLLAAPCNLLLLDEPTNHLDMYSCEAFSAAVKLFEGTVILVTHDEYLLKDVATRLIIFDRDKVEFYPGTYDEFLDRIGWSDEQEISEQDASTKTSLSKKELRRQKAAYAKEKKIALSSLENQCSKIESKISQIEGSIAEQESALIEGTKTGYSDEMAKLSRQIHRDKNLREELYEELEKVSVELEQAEKNFELQWKQKN